MTNQWCARRTSYPRPSGAFQEALRAQALAEDVEAPLGLLIPRPPAPRGSIEGAAARAW